ncbi:hypothetical protein J6590_098752 [Homalodisca vitripennis]|nr:hypothetical protein J6590_098752 [Homalodisca vitripennis]
MNSSLQEQAFRNRRPVFCSVVVLPFPRRLGSKYQALPSTGSTKILETPREQELKQSESKKRQAGRQRVGWDSRPFCGSVSATSRMATDHQYVQPEEGLFLRWVVGNF